MPDLLEVAIVEDDGSLREALESLLSAEGYKTRAFDSAEGYLRSAGEAGCLVVDWTLPRMSGLELLQHLRAAGDRVPVVMISAHAERFRQARALRSGALACLQKPFACAELLAAVGRAIQESRRRACRQRAP